MCIRLCLRPNLAELCVFEDFVAEAHFSCLPQRFVRCRQVHGATQWSHLRDLISLLSFELLHTGWSELMYEKTQALSQAHLLLDVGIQRRRNLQRTVMKRRIVNAVDTYSKYTPSKIFLLHAAHSTHYCTSTAGLTVPS